MFTGAPLFYALRNIRRYWRDTWAELLYAGSAVKLSLDTTQARCYDCRIGQAVSEGVAVYKKEIVYDPETRDFALYLDGELVGFARTYQEGEETLNQLVYELTKNDYKGAA